MAARSDRQDYRIRLYEDFLYQTELYIGYLRSKAKNDLALEEDGVNAGGREACQKDMAALQAVTEYLASIGYDVDGRGRPYPMPEEKKGQAVKVEDWDTGWVLGW